MAATAVCHRAGLYANRGTTSTKTAETIASALPLQAIGCATRAVTRLCDASAQRVMCVPPRAPFPPRSPCRLPLPPPMLLLGVRRPLFPRLPSSTSNVHLLLLAASPLRPFRLPPLTSPSPLPLPLPSLPHLPRRRHSSPFPHSLRLPPRPVPPTRNHPSTLVYQTRRFWPRPS